MTFKLGIQSLARLDGVHPDLVRVVKRAIEITSVDFKVIEGVRSYARQKKLYAQGRTPPGRVVTWKMKSKHLIQADGYGHAVDLLPAPYDWKEEEPFDRVAIAMVKAAGELDVKIRWGGNWDGDGRPHEKGETDGPHFELA